MIEPPLIARSLDVMGGTPVFAGTRVPVQTLMDYLEGGETLDDFLEGFPTVSREQVVAFLEEAKDRMVAAALVRIFLDECIDRRLANDIAGHEVKTALQMGWASIKNGELLALAEQQFEIFVTVDRNLSFQQHLPRYKLAVIVLRAQSNRLRDLRPLVPKLLEVLPVARQGEVLGINADGVSIPAS